MIVSIFPIFYASIPYRTIMMRVFNDTDCLLYLFSKGIAPKDVSHQIRETDPEKGDGASSSDAAPALHEENRARAHTELKKEEEVDPHPIDGAWIAPSNLWIIARYKAVPFLKKILTHGTSGPSTKPTFL